MQAEANPREQRGKQIVSLPNQVRRIDDTEYRVLSQTCEEIEYQILAIESGFVCSCPDFKFREVKCKHIFAVEISQALREVAKPKVELSQVNPSVCQYCNSQNITRYGVRHNKSGDIQVYSCKDCKNFFTLNLGFEKMHANPQAITGAMQLYFSGESLRSVQKFLLLQGVKVSHVTVLNWIHKYISLMQKYVEKIAPNVSSTWRTDELYVKIKGKQNYLFALMDDETRFWISQQVADSKGISDIREMFRESKRLVDVEPKKIISDGAQNFIQAIDREYATQNPRPVHVRKITLRGEIHNNNKMERLNGELRDREKVMRSLKRKDTPILKGMQIYHNYIREHMSLGTTPAEKAGIKINGENRWMTLIQNAKLDETKRGLTL